MYAGYEHQISIGRSQEEFKASQDIIVVRDGYIQIRIKFWFRNSVPDFASETELA